VGQNFELKFGQKIENSILLRKEILQFYADNLTHGNLEKAKTKLENRMRGNRKKDIAIIYFHIGMAVALFLTHMILYLFENNNSISVFFPSFGFTFSIILIFFGIGVNIKVYKKYRINYIFIFNIDPRYRLTSTEIFKVDLFNFLDCFFVIKYLGNFIFTSSSLFNP
jgi:hypothetical protein